MEEKISPMIISIIIIIIICMIAAIIKYLWKEKIGDIDTNCIKEYRKKVIINNISELRSKLIKDYKNMNDDNKSIFKLQLNDIITEGDRISTLAVFVAVLGIVFKDGFELVYKSKDGHEIQLIALIIIVIVIGVGIIQSILNYRTCKICLSVIEEIEDADKKQIEKDEEEKQKQIKELESKIISLEAQSSAYIDILNKINNRK